MLSKTTRLRKAILGMTVTDQYAPLVTVDDIKRRWSSLWASGSSPYRITEEANSEEIDDLRFEYLMKLLNSYL